MSLPPRHIRRYPASSSGSSSTAGPGSLDEGEEEDVFLKYNQSYHTITSNESTKVQNPRRNSLHHALNSDPTGCVLYCACA